MKRPMTNAIARRDESPARMSALARFQMMESDPIGYQRFADAEAARMNERINGLALDRNPNCDHCGAPTIGGECVVDGDFEDDNERAEAGRLAEAFEKRTPAMAAATIPASGYARLIALLSPRPLSADEIRWVEAWMRVEHHTLNHLSQSQAKKEIGIALECIAASTHDESESLARSFGL